MKKIKKLSESARVKKSNWLKRELQKLEDDKWLVYSSKIGRRLLSAIEDNKDMTQQTLAEQLNLSYQYVNRVAKGKENLSLKTIAKLSEAVGVELISFPYYKDMEIDLSAVKPPAMYNMFKEIGNKNEPSYLYPEMQS